MGSLYVSFQDVVIIVQGMGHILPADRTGDNEVRFLVKNVHISRSLMLTLDRLRSDNTADGRLTALMK